MKRVVGVVLVVVAGTAPFWVWNAYHLHTLIMAGIFSILAMSLNLLLGYTGQLSLGHAAFFGIGAYTSALLTLKLEWSPWVGLLVAILLAGLSATLVYARIAATDDGSSGGGSRRRSAPRGRRPRGPARRSA